MDIQKGTYKHFKGHVYKVIGIAKHSESLEEYVVYVNTQDSNDIWIRLKDNFLETVTRDGKTFPRFELIEAGESDE
jgi:hypothetical protein